MNNFDLRPTELTDFSDLSKGQRKGFRTVFAVAAICIMAIVASIFVEGASPEASRIAQSANVVVD